MASYLIDKHQLLTIGSFNIVIEQFLTNTDYINI